MQTPNIRKVLEGFNKEIDNNLHLIKSVNLSRSSRIQRGPILTQRDFFKIVELSFLRMFISWEKFLENTFVRYMLSSNNSKVKSHFKAQSINHAYEVLKEGKRFPDWTNIDDILRKSQLFFKNGGPYVSALNPVRNEIVDIKRIRNAIVHISGEAQEKFTSFVRSVLGTYPKGLTPGKFLWMSKSNALNTTYLEYYINILKLTASIISK